jgi:uncharacterized protein YecE (DUF72 family)
MSRHGGRIHIGTSGWSYDHWKGPFYPDDLPSGRMLEYYARSFRSTEINSSFYGLPEPETLRRWRDATPGDFLFAAKASGYITHRKKLRDPRETVAIFLDRISLLGDKLGPILFQLPPRWHYDEARLAAFLKALSTEFRYVFEFRDRSWLNPRTYELLSRYHAGFCIYELDGFLAPEEITADHIYVRLHGPGGAYEGNYDAKTLSAWAARLSAWAQDGYTIYCYFDNDQLGYAVRNAECLQRILAKSNA